MFTHSGIVATLALVLSVLVTSPVWAACDGTVQTPDCVISEAHSGEPGYDIMNTCPYAVTLNVTGNSGFDITFNLNTNETMMGTLESEMSDNDRAALVGGDNNTVCCPFFSSLTQCSENTEPPYNIPY